MRTRIIIYSIVVGLVLLVIFLLFRKDQGAETALIYRSERITAFLEIARKTKNEYDLLIQNGYSDGAYPILEKISRDYSQTDNDYIILYLAFFQIQKAANNNEGAEIERQIDFINQIVEKWRKAHILDYQKSFLSYPITALEKVIPIALNNTEQAQKINFSFERLKKNLEGIDFSTLNNLKLQVEKIQNQQVITE